MGNKEPTMSNKADFDPPEGLKPLKTWSHLAGKRRKPSEYEVVTPRLQYSTDNPDLPWMIGPNETLNVWYRKYRNACPLKHDDWDAFRDPDQMIYRNYTVIQDGQEHYVDGLLEEHRDIDHDEGLSEDWVEVLTKLYTPGRYLVHTVQMASAYLFIIAPASTISVCTMFQSSDQFRWVSHIAYRTAELVEHRPGKGFGKDERRCWEEDGAWQGFRELMERILVAYDWGETFTALNLVAKVAIDEAFLRQFGNAARRNGDALLALMADAQLRDSDRSRRWTKALVEMLLEKDGNKKVLEDWIGKWVPLGDQAIDAFCAALPDVPEAAEEAKRAATAFRSGLGLAG